MNIETEQIFIVNSTGNQPSSASQKVFEVPVTTQVNLENVEDLSTVCRTCATVTEFLIPIFAGEGLQNNLVDKIHKHLPIQVSEQDVLPRAVCYQCAHTLLAWHELAACCEQADLALRTTLQQLQEKAAHQETKSTNSGSSAHTITVEIENKPQKEYEDVTFYVVPAGEPPQYAEAAGAPPLSACEYCALEIPEPSYREHLVAAHSNSLFQCDECDSYVDRKHFIRHMSLHAEQYASSEANELQQTIKKKGRAKTNSSETNKESELKEKTKPQPDNLEKTENEFSDHSDAESGFGPLPESVFEAIEDSQDSQPEHDSSQSYSPETAESTTGEKEPHHKRTRTCPICSKVYTASSSYFYHMKYFHKQSKEHKCGVCGRMFGTRGGLAQHAGTHSAETRFACQQCGKRFRSKASQYIHEQTHSGVKTYSCEQCQVSFRWRTHLMRHLKRHAAERAHACDTCGRAFSVRCDLLRHQRTHAAGEFACDKCGAKFAQIRYLKVHMDKKHNTNIVANGSQTS